MLISFDVKGLEVVCGAYLSKDEVLYDELIRGVDVHGENQRSLELPDGDFGRYIAKRFKFKLLYGGTPFGFSTDPEFIDLGYSPAKWERVVEEYYGKYRGIERWHTNLVQEVLRTGKIISPTGREYDYSTLLGRPEWYYIPKIKNYPVQGLGADLVSVIRITLYRRMKAAKCRSKLVNTVHDDIWVDAPIEEVKGVDKNGNPCYNILLEMEKVFQDLPKNLEKAYGLVWDLPIKYEYTQVNGEEVGY